MDAVQKEREAIARFLRKPSALMIEAAMETTRNADAETRMLYQLGDADQAQRLKMKQRYAAMIEVAIRAILAGAHHNTPDAEREAA